VLWKTDLPTSANSVPMTYQIRPDGRQFVVIAAGGHWGAPNPPGDHLMAFALPE
jgi:quinoprotein glucose dehydrogenase